MHRLRLVNFSAEQLRATSFAAPKSARSGSINYFVSFQPPNSLNGELLETMQLPTESISVDLSSALRWKKRGEKSIVRAGVITDSIHCCIQSQGGIFHCHRIGPVSPVCASIYHLNDLFFRTSIFRRADRPRSLASNRTVPLPRPPPFSIRNVCRVNDIRRRFAFSRDASKMDGTIFPLPSHLLNMRKEKIEKLN